MVRPIAPLATDKPTLLLDASIYIFQYYFSLPDHWHSREGWPTGAVYGFTTFLLRLLETEEPRRIAACFDTSLGSCFRNQLYPNYKMSRVPPDEALAFQLKACRQVAEMLGIACFSSKSHEADDLIGSLCRAARRARAPVAILSRDKDLGQLLRREQDWLWDYANNERYHAQHIHLRFGVTPLQLADYLALVGDRIDDIPGVPGLGPKTAAALLVNHGCIDGLFRNLEFLSHLPVRGAKGLAKKLQQHREQIYIARQLATIVDSLKLASSLRDLDWSPRQARLSRLYRFCGNMGFPRLSSRVEQVLGS